MINNGNVSSNTSHEKIPHVSHRLSLLPWVLTTGALRVPKPKELLANLYPLETPVNQNPTAVGISIVHLGASITDTLILRHLYGL